MVNKSMEIKDIINMSVEKAVKKSITAISEKQKQGEKQEIDYFKSTEKLLYSYPKLKELIEDEDTYFEEHTRAKDVVRISSSGGSYDDCELYTNNRKISLERTKQDVDWIEKALNKVRDRKDYNIIKLKYFKEMTVEEIAEKLDIDISTVSRRKNRIINDLSIYLFGSGAVISTLDKCKKRAKNAP